MNGSNLPTPDRGHRRTDRRILSKPHSTNETAAVWRLATVQARFVRQNGINLSEADLDRLAGTLIDIENVVTVRVDSAGSTVYRVDVDPAATDPARDVTRPLEEVSRSLGLASYVESIRIETHEEQATRTARALGT